MTYENAQRVTEEFSRNGEGYFCVPASLDSVLERTSIEKTDYLRFMGAFASKQSLTNAEIAANPNINQQSLCEHMVDKYFPGKEIGGGWKTAVWAIDADHIPFHPDYSDGLNTPKPEHFALSEVLEDLVVRRERGEIDDMYYNALDDEYRAGIGLYVAIDNAMDEGLKVLGMTQNVRGSRGLHVFGIERESQNCYYIYNSYSNAPTPDLSLKKIGPLTLKEVVGLPEPNRPKKWPKITDRYDLFTLIQGADGNYYSGIRLFPPES